MIKEHVTLFRRLLIISDIFVCIASFYLGYFLSGAKNIYPLEIYLSLLSLFILIWVSILYLLGMYHSFRTKPLYEILFTISKTTIFGFLSFCSVIYVLKLPDISRALVTLIFFSAIILTTLEKLFLVIFFRYVRKTGYNYKNILIVGTSKRARHFMNLITQHNEWGLKIIGVLDDDPQKTGDLTDGHKIIGSFNDLADILHKNVVDNVVFIVPRLWFEKIEDLIRLCEIEGIPASVAIDLYELKFSRVKQTDLHGFPLLTFESTPDKLWHLLAKRIFDVIFSGVTLILLLPLFIIIAIITKITSKGSIFFKQERCGLNGRRFTLYKFRTMVEGAEEKLSKLLEFNEMKGPAFKMKNDPRITPTGKLLRKFSLDELPQLWNVFEGDMSLVGPRPPLPSEVAKYDNWQRRRLTMRPGLTCLWQIEGRNKIISFDEWAKLDLEYIDNWSLSLDLEIFFKTIPVVLLAKGAK